MAEHLDYRVGIGHDLELASTDVILQQPKVESGAVKPVDVQYGVSGTHHKQGEYVCFIFDSIESPDLFQDILAQFGVDDQETEDVTIYAWNDRLFWRHYNGKAHRPIPGEDYNWENFFLRNVRIYVTDLEEIA